MFNKLLDYYELWVRRAVVRPGLTVVILMGVFLLSLAIYPLLGLAFFPKTDAGQFTINVKFPPALVLRFRTNTSRRLKI